MPERKATRNPHALFVIEGDCQRPQAASRLDLAEIHAYYQIADLATVDERLSGRAVRLRKLIDLAGPGYGTEWLTVESLDGGYSVSLPLAETARTAVIVYERDGKPLEPEDGGPARFLVPFHPDACVNVKSIARIVISRERGRDTRPADRAAHQAHHAKG